jgi:hypothetical protein
VELVIVLSGSKTLFRQLPIILYQGTLNQTLEIKRITNPEDLFPHAIVYGSPKTSSLYVHVANVIPCC